MDDFFLGAKVKDKGHLKSKAHASSPSDVASSSKRLPLQNFAPGEKARNRELRQSNQRQEGGHRKTMSRWRSLRYTILETYPRYKRIHLHSDNGFTYKSFWRPGDSGVPNLTGPTDEHCRYERQFHQPPRIFIAPSLAICHSWQFPFVSPSENISYKPRKRLEQPGRSVA